MTRSTLGQILSCLDVHVELDSGRRLHQAKAIPSRSQAEMVTRVTRDARDLILALMPHKEAIRALLAGVKLVPADLAAQVVVQMDNDGGPE